MLAVDDHPTYLAVLRDLVGATDTLELAAEAVCGEEAVELARDLKPDMVLMDVRMPGLGGIGAARQIRTRLPSTVIVLVSTAHPDELPLEPGDGVADAVIWKSELHPDRLDEIWLSRR